MATSQYVWKDGHRIDITGLLVSEETRCDVCGEYVADRDVTTVKVVISLLYGLAAEQSTTGHEKCAVRAAQIMADNASQALTA